MSESIKIEFNLEHLVDLRFLAETLADGGKYEMKDDRHYSAVLFLLNELCKPEARAAIDAVEKDMESLEENIDSIVALA